jgi:hypothetical protein
MSDLAKLVAALVAAELAKAQGKASPAKTAMPFESPFVVASQPVKAKASRPAYSGATAELAKLLGLEVSAKPKKQKVLTDEEFAQSKLFRQAKPYDVLCALAKAAPQLCDGRKAMAAILIPHPTLKGKKVRVEPTPEAEGWVYVLFKPTVDPKDSRPTPEEARAMKLLGFQPKKTASGSWPWYCATSWKKSA